MSTPVEADAGTHEHLGRIQWLADNGWEDPIFMEVGFDIRVWPVTDGNHRLCAAILRGDTTITVECFGDLDAGNALLAPDRPW